MTSKKKTTKTAKRKKKNKVVNKLAYLPKIEDMKTFMVEEGVNLLDEEETLVEQVLNERNLITTPAVEHTAPVHHETALGKVRIEGEVTPQKLALAKQFEQVFAASVDEIMDLASMTPNPETMDFVKTSGLSSKQVEEMKKASPWTTFQIKGETLLKTTDNKIENVKFYFYRLERAVIQQINLRKEAEEVAETLRSELKSTQSEYVKLLDKVRNNFREDNTPKSILLPIKDFFSNIFKTVINLLK